MNRIDLDIAICMDCLQYMQTMPSQCVDAVITSPPYANQRQGTYGGIAEEDYPVWMADVGSEIYRILKPSGSFVLNIKENVIDGRRSTYVLETILYLSRLFIWSDTYIWNKINPFPTGSKSRLKDGFEYCYLFTKTKSHKFNPDSVLVKSTSKYLESEKRRENKGSHKVSNGSGMNMSMRCSPDMVRPSNVLTLPIDSTNHKHPASFPTSLSDFFIKLLTDEGDVVYDPFAGSGTTLVSAMRLGRHYIGTEINREYMDIIEERIATGR